MALWAATVERVVFKEIVVVSAVLPERRINAEKAIPAIATAMITSRRVKPLEKMDTLSFLIMNAPEGLYGYNYTSSELLSGGENEKENQTWC